MNENESVLRDFEANILDRHYLTFPVWGDSPRRRAWGLLTAYDGFALSHYLVQNESKSPYAVQRLKYLHETLSIALRWHFTDSPDAFPSPTSDSALISRAGKFLLFAADHFLLSNMHSIYGRGGVQIECDRSRRIVRFVPRVDALTPPWHPLVEGGISEEMERSARAPIEARLGKAAFEVDHMLVAGRIVLRHPEQIRELNLLGDAAGLVAAESLPLPDDVQIESFSMGTFRRFWATLEVWSFISIQLYLNMTVNGVDQSLCMPTQFLSFSRFIDSMQAITGAARSEIEGIVDLLTFDGTGRKADAILQPFIRGADEIAWSPLAVRLSKPERNLLKIMSRTTHLQNHAANLIGGREKQLLDSVGRLLAKRAGFEFKLNQRISAGSQQAEVDLLAYCKRAPGEILLVEAKAILGSDDVNEVAESGRVMQEAERQLTRCAEILERTDREQLARVFKFVDWSRVRSVHRLIVTPDTPPPSTFDATNGAAVSFLTMKHSFRHRDLQTPARIWHAARARPRIASPQRSRVEYESIQVGEVTYEVPVAVLEESR